MPRFFTFTALLFVGLLNFIPANAQTTADRTPVGRWLTQSGNLEIDIAPCGKSLCGTVVRVLANQSMSQPGTEMKSGDGQSAMGMKILSELSPSGDGEWEGRIYNRENGKTYDCRLGVSAQDQLEVRAYVWLPLFGKTQMWTRVNARKS